MMNPNSGIDIYLSACYPACAYSYANTIHSIVNKLQAKLRTVLAWYGTFVRTSTYVQAAYQYPVPVI